MASGPTLHSPAQSLSRLVPTYSSDETGLIVGFHFPGAGPAQQIDGAQAAAWLRRASAENLAGYVWLHFDLARVATEKWLHEHLTLPDAFYDVLREGTRASRIEYVDGWLVAVINDVLYDFTFDSSSISTLWATANARLVVTARRHALRSIDRLRDSVRAGDAPATTTELVVHLLRDQADVLVGITRTTTEHIDQIEDRLLADRLDVNRASLGSLRRVLVRLRRLLAPEPAALFRMLNRPPGWMGEHDLQELRQSTEEFSTTLNDVATLLERIKLLQEDVASRVNEQNNRLLLLLSLVTVVGLPFTVIGGLFGMNVGGIPFNEDKHGFWIVVGVVGAFTAIAIWLMFRWRRK
jgi:zinc transporter